MLRILFRELPPVVNLRLGFNDVTVKRDGADLFLDQHAHCLRLRCASARIANDIVFKRQLIRCATNSYSRFTVVFDYIRPQMISMSGHSQRFVTEENTTGNIANHPVVLDQIV